MRLHAKELLAKILAMAILAITTGVASAQIFVTDPGHKRVSEYSLSGVPINLSFISGFDTNSEGPSDVFLAGTNIYVLCTIYTNGDGFGTISKYNLDGSVVNPALIANIPGYPQYFTIQDTNIFVSSGNSGVIGKYTTSGATINASLITGLEGPEQIAISGTNLFVAVFSGQKIGKYTTSGAVVNSLLITNLGQVNGIAISGTNLFTAETSVGRVGKYTTDGITITNALVRSLVYPRALTLSGTNLYVTDDFYNRVGSYTFSGEINNATLIGGLLYGYGGLAVVPPFRSITATNSAVLLTWETVEGHTYQIQFTTNLTQPRWANFLSPITATSFTASASNHISVDPQRFYRVLNIP